MDRRSLLQSTVLAATAITIPRGGMAMQSSDATPRSHSPEDRPVDTRARDLVARLHGLSPLDVLEALETAEVADQALTEAAADAPVTALPWNDPLDTDLENALGGVLIIAGDDPVNSPDLVMLGAYIVFESVEIAYDQFMRQIKGLEQSGTSISVAGTKVWILDDQERQTAVTRLAYVWIMADVTGMQGNVAEGVVKHLDAVTRAIT